MTVSLVPVATVTVTPASSSLTVGQTGQLTATLRDAAGNVLTGRTVTWSSNQPSAGDGEWEWVGDGGGGGGGDDHGDERGAERDGERDGERWCRWRR